MKLKYIIVDDEPLAQRLIEKYAGQIPSMELIAKCKSAFEAMDLLIQRQPDVIFLDINMPNMTGMELMKTLNNPPAIIITTAYREYALESYDFNVVDYLKKPFSFERFYQAVQKTHERIKAKTTLVDITEKPDKVKEFIFVKSDKKIIKLSFIDIDYIESYGDYIKMHTINQMILVLMPLKKMLEQLDDRFIRVHKSFIVSIDKIDLVEGNIVKIKNVEIPIGKSFRQKFHDLIKP